MTKEIGYTVFRGWCQWQRNRNGYGYVRSCYLFPYLKVSFPFGVGKCLFYSEFGFLFWGGQFSISTITKEEKKHWREEKYAV